MNNKILISAALFAIGFAISGCASSGETRLSFNQEQRMHEQSACAELGLDPGTQAFAQCVGDLDATLFADFMPH